MAHVKCRYHKAYCSFAKTADTEFCFYENFGCSTYEKEPNEKRSDGTLVIHSDTCKHLKFMPCELEGDYKKYEYVGTGDYDEDVYDEGFLKLPRRDAIDWYNIAYLEIDGRVLIGEQETNNTGEVMR